MPTELRNATVVTEYQAVCDTGDKWVGSLTKDQQQAQSDLRNHSLTAHGGHIRTTTTVIATAATVVTDSDNGANTLTTTTLTVPGVGKVQVTFLP